MPATCAVPRKPGRTLRMSDRSGLTGWEIVRKAEALHPEWTLEDHVAHLSKDEGQDIDPIRVARWLRNIAADKGS